MRAVAAMQPLHRGAKRIFGKLHRAAGHGEHQTPGRGDAGSVQTEQFARRGGGAETAEQGRRVIAGFDHLGSADGAPDAAHGLVTGGDGGHDDSAARLMLDAERQCGRNDHRAGMADRAVMGIVKLHAVRGAGVHQRRHVGRGAERGAEHDAGAAAGIAPRPVPKRQTPWLLGAAPADADMVQYQPFDLRAVRRAQRLVVERG